jgi:hypothetical protein
MDDAFYLPLGHDRWRATVHTAGPWDARFQHGGPPSALLARAIERCSPREDMLVARMAVDILGGIPVDDLELPAAQRLLICADGGGSNGSRVRAWKIELAAFAADTALTVTVAHLPPGTSKWNKIEHRLFSQITLNWRGRPLTSHQVIVDLIANTTTTTGLSVRAVLDTGQYPTGISYSDKDIAALPLVRHDFHGDWNYSLLPRDTP